jgi:hypothetical protein
MEAVSYRADDDARSARADALITEIGDLERQKVAQAQADERLAAARRELADLQGPAEAVTLPRAPAERAPGVVAHALAFVAAAAMAFTAYTLLG